MEEEGKLEHYYMDISEKGGGTRTGAENYVYGSAHSTERRSHICQTSFGGTGDREEEVEEGRREREIERQRP